MNTKYIFMLVVAGCFISCFFPRVREAGAVLEVMPEGDNQILNDEGYGNNDEEYYNSEDDVANVDEPIENQENITANAK